ncbi:MAG: DUF481 domain-containing protein [Paludibacteraceae bacterium]|nr:DUF481 domain-containing protein [Paludibacteraceae bacterium]MBN2787783.1 DUF481 domain-containing protein [Paludibacteraceae bacterium]
MKKDILLLFFTAVSFIAFAQKNDSIAYSPTKLKLFLECTDCDHAYYMNQLPFVGFVRDVKDADLHVYITKQKNASEGFRYYLNFVGKNSFADINYKLQTDSPDSESRLKRNDRILKTLKMGLTPYVSRTDVSERVFLTCNDSIKISDPTIKDPWNFWVFVLDLGGNLEAEESYYNYQAKGNLNCKRITEEWKHRFVFTYAYENETYDYKTTNIKQSIQNAFTFHTRSVYAINRHWSAQYSAAIKQDTYYNYGFYWDLGPGVEYNFFPWDKSDRKVFALRYEFKARYYDYIQPTINDLTEDLIWNHFVALELILRQPWGDIESEAKYSTYIPDWNQYNLSLKTQLSVKVARGFSVFLKAEGALINDQHYLPKVSSSLTDRLLQARKEKTPFELNGEIGIRYAFGSIYNSVVNHRF